LVQHVLRPSVRSMTALTCIGAFVVACGAESTPTNGGIAPTNDRPIAATTDSGIAPSTAAQAAAPMKFDSSRAYEHLRRQVGFGPRPAGSAALTQTRQYILAELKAAGIEAREDGWDAMTPLGRVRMVNVIATIPGRRPERIGLATHYDTKLVREFRFVGASDAASSTAAVLELGRLLKGRQNEFTIELLFFDGEEAVVEWYKNNDNTYGSRHYVETAQKAGTLAGLKTLILLDMIGDRNLTIRRDSNSTPWLTDIVWASAGRLGYRANFLPDETTIEDDHVPFTKAGVPSVDIIDLDYPAWHTAQDDLDHVSARSLQIVGDVVLAALPDIEKRLGSGR
jgi:glutaminyl-peptide cyclotransferase